MEVKSENGCVVRYSETPIELPTKEKVYFKIENPLAELIQCVLNPA